MKPVFESMQTVSVKDLQGIKEITKEAEKNGLEQITIDLSTNGKVIQKVKLVSVKSNLIDNKFIWMFYCDKVNKRAFKLYVNHNNGKLYHRERFANVLYRKQTYSKQMREVYVPIWDKTKDKYSNEMQQPYFKKYYNGKATKRYEYLQQKDIEAQQKNMEALKKLSQIFN